MGDEIEKYLVANVISKLPDPRSKYEDLEQLLQPSSSSTPSSAPKLSREKLYNLNNLLTEWHMKSKKGHSLVSKCLSYTLNRNIDRIKAELREKENGTSSNGVTTQPSSNSNQVRSVDGEAEERESFSRYIDENKVYGFQDKAMSLQRFLVQVEKKEEEAAAKFKAVGIVGMRGIGKSTLCKLIFNKPEVKNHFLPRIWVRPSQHRPGDERDMRKEIVKGMLESLGVEEDIINHASNKEPSLKRLLFALRLQLAGKRYLVVLDNVWNQDESHKDFYSSIDQDEKCSEKLAYGLPKEFGGTVIVTSRTEELAKDMVGEENLHKLLPLSDKENCWNIFKDAVEKDDIVLSDALKSLQAKIIDKCAGLPLAAKMMGEIAHEHLLKEKQGDQQEEVRPQTN